MEESVNKEGIGEGFLFQHLVAMFQTLALQQLGKLTNPLSGKLERDLHQAKITIDMLEMIKSRMEGNLLEDEEVLLDRVLMELQMNYVDESSKSEESEPDNKEDTEEDKRPEEGSKKEEKKKKRGDGKDEKSDEKGEQEDNNSKNSEGK